MPAKGAGTSNGADYEQTTYESVAGGTSGLVAAFRNRAGETIGMGYDALGRMTSKDLPGTEPDASYAHDLLGRLLSATQNGIAVTFTWDALGRQLTQTIPIPSIANPVFTSEWDLAGRRTRYTWPVDASSPTAYYVDYDHLVTGEVDKIREKGATSGAGVLATFGYDDLGRRTSLTRGNGAVTTYTYDPVSRLGSMTHDLAGTTHDLTLGYAYNPASQIVSTTRSNNLYSWTGHGSGTTSSTANGLNQLATHAGGTPTYDARGNLTADGTYGYTYSSENLMTSGANSGLLEYDPLMRFYKSGPTYFIHEGGQLVGDYFNGSIVSRYIPGPGTDEALAEVFKTGARTWYHADERGSVIAGSNATGANARIVLFDEYGKRGSGGSYRFAFTGQVHLINDIYDYKARNYNARLGRFVQTDPIGYGDGMNMYGYVGGDPVNASDPSGLCAKDEHLVTDTGTHIGRCVRIGSHDSGGVAGGYSGFSTAGPGGRSGGHYEYIAGHGPAATGSDGSIVISGYRIWVSDAWSFGGSNYVRTVVAPALDHAWDGLKDGVNVARCVVGEAGVAVDGAGGQITNVGAHVAVVGGVVGLTGAGTGQPELAALGLSVLNQGVATMAIGGLTSLVGTGMRAVGGDYSAFLGRGAVRTAGRAIPNPLIRAGTTSSANKAASPSSKGIPACD